LQKELLNLGQIMCFGQKSKNTTTTNQKSKHKSLCRSQELNAGPLAPQSDVLLLRKLNLSIEVKLFNCFNIMDRNINKQSQMCGPQFSTFFFCFILTCTDNNIWQFLIFMGVVFTAKVWLKKKFLTSMVKRYRHL